MSLPQVDVRVNLTMSVKPAPRQRPVQPSSPRPACDPPALHRVQPAPAWRQEPAIPALDPPHPRQDRMTADLRRVQERVERMIDMEGW